MTVDSHADSHGAAHTSTGLSNNKLGMWLFLGSECLLFGGLISTYMLYRGRVGEGPRPSQVLRESQHTKQKPEKTMVEQKLEIA